MSKEEFCNLYNGFYGEKIDRPEQIAKHVFDGQELKEFMEYLQARFLGNPNLYKPESPEVAPQGEESKIAKALMSGFMYGHSNLNNLDFTERIAAGEFTKLCEIWGIKDAGQSTQQEGQEVSLVDAMHKGIAFANERKTESEAYNSGLGYGYTCGYAAAIEELKQSFHLTRKP